MLLASFNKFDPILKGAYVRCEASGTFLHLGLLSGKIIRSERMFLFILQALVAIINHSNRFS